MIFAIATPDSAFVWQLILVAAMLASVGANVAVITSVRRVQRREITPNPLMVQEAHEFVTKAQCENYHKSLDAQLVFLNTQRVNDAKDGSQSRKGIYVELECVRKEMVEMERRLNRADEDRATGLHTRLNEILGEVSEMRGQMKKT